MAEPASKKPALPPDQVLQGTSLLIAAFALALSNFMVVLDTTIANVSVEHIAGGLAISASQGTWIITSYSVAEAVCVPLTGFLSLRYGAVKTFIMGMAGFAIFSALCGMSTNLPMLVICRLGQGFCGGPLMPLTQTLLLRIFPKEKHGAAMGMWAMTTVTAPILGPILGGTISDNWSWHWIFFINLPVAAVCLFISMRYLRAAETPTSQPRIDVVGLGLLVGWVACLQLMLDLGHDRDWFNNNFILALGILAAIGFLVFCAWEFTDAHPVVDLRVLRHRGFTVATLAMAACFGTYFTSAVIIPQWLQSSQGYTATYAGYVTAFSGMSAVVMSPFVARWVTRVDPRLLVFLGITWLGVTTLMRAHWNSGGDFWTFAFPQLLQGIGLPLFFVPVTTIALGAVSPEETASAAGVMSFLRTLSGAVATSIVTTAWDSDSRISRNELVSQMNTGPTRDALDTAGFSLGQIRGVIEQQIATQSTAVATTHIFLASSFLFFASALIIWLAPRPRGKVDTSAAH
ncbi:DHA2 family efflux MFS transporter permease subunit [Novosphingobium sp.]|jgi:DHA2 family multidrug resistance protein|uniref:DHA2 family efflux MFS transporter permease subunit n=1 Tax=Novosphingobium sp. TaxID=1874826 RepID=UPI0031DF4A6A